MKPDLDLILSGIRWTQTFKHPFRATTKTEIIRVETPIYAVPGQLVNGSFQIGIYNFNEELISVPKNFVTAYGVIYIDRDLTKELIRKTKQPENDY